MIDYLQKTFPGQFLKLKVGDPISYSSIEGDTDELGHKTSGARFKFITYEKYEQWDFLPWNISDKRFKKQWKSVEQLFAYCASRAGKVGYDWEGILGQAFGIDSLEDGDKTFCSEEVSELMGFTSNPSPARLYTLVKGILASKV